MDMLEVFLIVIFGVPIISLLVYGLIAADVMQRQEEQGRTQVASRRNRALTREHLARLKKNGMRARLVRG